jgi:hypothetical protein
MDIAIILEKKYPESEWTLSGEDYSGLVWISKSPKPSEKELRSLWPEVQYEFAYERVERARAAAYLKHSDQIFFQWQRGTATKQEWLDAVQLVKDAHPYPEAV